MSTPISTQRHFPLGWLRGVAALTVVLFHSYQYNRTDTWPLTGWAHELMLGSDMFVDMFFVLSAFVLWLPVARSALDGTTGRPGRIVLFRRMARLLPLYVTVIVVVWALTNPSLPGHWQDLLLHLTFTHVYNDQYVFWTNGPAWSLAVEFHFYVLIAMTIPFIHAATRRVRSRFGRVAIAMSLPLACAAVGAAYLSWQILVAQPPETDWSAWFNPLAKALDFGIGMALAVVCASGVRLGSAARLAAGVLGIAAIVVLVMNRPLHGIESNWWHPAFALSIAVGLTAVVLHDGPDVAWMSWRPLTWIGGLGYGIYLIHEPVQRYVGSLGLLPERQSGMTFVATALIVAVPSVILAWLSSKTVEDAGSKTLGLVDNQSNRSRDYYAHVGAAGSSR